MVTVALIGADGAGKTTIGRRLEKESTLPIKYIYMGINPEASNHLLPTTRVMLRIKRALGKSSHMGGPPDPTRSKPRYKSFLKRVLFGLKSNLRIAHQLGEEWYRQCFAWYYQRRGYVVIFDRHYYADYYAHDIGGDASRRPLSRRIHGFFLNRLYPKPDLVILLDAPARLLFARKREGTVSLIERRRQEYWQLRDRVPHFAVVDADHPVDDVTRHVLEVIQDFSQGKNRPDR